MADLTIGVRKAGPKWRGVLRDGKTIVWECEHYHRNRDQSTSLHPSARDCAGKELGTRRVEDEWAQIMEARRG